MCAILSDWLWLVSETDLDLNKRRKHTLTDM
jgi:hypothetical protein